MSARLDPMAREVSVHDGLVLGTEGFRGGRLRLLVHQARPSSELDNGSNAFGITLERFVEGHLYDPVHLGDVCVSAHPPGW